MGEGREECHDARKAGTVLSIIPSTQCIIIIIIIIICSGFFYVNKQRM